MGKYEAFRSARLYIFSLSLLIATMGSSNDETAALMTRSDAIKEDVSNASDQRLEGYIQALIDMNYYETDIIVIVRDKKVYLSNLPKNKLFAMSIIAFVKDIPGIQKVIVTDKPIEEREAFKKRKRINGIWFPQNTVLFQPMVANPRQIKYSLAYRMGDNVIGNQVAAFSFGDEFPLYRWLNVWKKGGDLQISIEAGVWTVFNYDIKCNRLGTDQYAEHVNSDYYVGVPLTYAIDAWAFRLRVYHISSHLGDEFMIDNPKYFYLRVNPSMEAIDFFTSYQLTSQIRFYLGVGVCQSDETFHLDPFYFEYGVEARFMGYKSRHHGLYGTPFIAMHFRQWQELNFELDGTYVLGYEWSKLQGVGRKVRVYLEYHHGFSFEGQFFKKRTSYLSITGSYGF